VLNKWTLVYLIVPQIVLITAVIAYSLASVYDAHKEDKLKVSFVRQQALMSLIIMILLIVFADWQGNI
jgi:hypothetical protein